MKWNDLFTCRKLNSFTTNHKTLDWCKMKAFADDKLNVTQMTKFILDRVENIVGKEENAGYQHFLLFPQCCQESSLITRNLKTWERLAKAKVYTTILPISACTDGHGLIPSEIAPITRRQISDSSKLKEFALDNFKFDENGRKLSK